MATSYLDQIMELEAQKQALMTKAKTEALSLAEKAVADLNNLGFHYRLVEVGDNQTSTRTATSTSTRAPRKGGISEQVLALLKISPDGLPSSAVQEQLGATDKAAKQSIANALSGLKNKGLLSLENGTWRAI